MARVLTCTVSDHQPDFLISPNTNSDISKHHNIYRRDWSNFDLTKFKSEYDKINWNESIKPEKNDANFSFNSFLVKLTELIDKFAPNKKLNNKQVKLLDKPWIKKGILTACRTHDSIFRKFKRLKDPLRKTAEYETYKRHRNMVSNLIWKSKKDYMTKYFDKHSRNTRKVWQGIKSIINVKNTNHFRPSCINTKNGPSSDYSTIANEFNIFFQL